MVAMDDVNRKIIEILQVSGRAPYSEIAAAVNLSEAAVRKRVNKLRDTGVIKIVAITDPQQMGYSRQAMVGITVEGDVAPVVEKLQEMDSIFYLVVATGRFDILAEILAKSDDDLQDLIYKEIRNIPGVRATETFQYLKVTKQIYNWGVV